MGTSLKAGLNQLANEHQYDTDAYIEAANAYIADAAAGVPEGFQGAFQQITTGLKVEHASGIGHRQGQQAIAEAAASMPAYVRDATAQTQAMILAGDVAGAEAQVEASVSYILAQPAHVMDAGQKAILPSYEMPEDTDAD